MAFFEKSLKRSFFNFLRSHHLSLAIENFPMLNLILELEEIVDLYLSPRDYYFEGTSRKGD
jgi:hypothetical protein